MIKECTPPAGCVLLYPTAIFLFQSFYSVRSWGKIGHLYLVRDDLCSVRMLPPDWSYLVYLHIPPQSWWWWWVIDGEAHSWSDWAWIVLGANIVTPPSTHTSRKLILDYLCTSLHNNEFMSPVVYFCSQNFFLIQISNSIFLPSPEKSFQPLALTMAPVAALAVWIN